MNYMDKPPISLFIPSYVVEYAIVDSTVKYMNKKNLWAGDEWLGAVPKLAISKDIETSEFRLSHCNEEWEDLCAVQSAMTIEEIKEIAEKHYQGINKKWIQTDYNESDAIALIEEEKEMSMCSFCGRSPWDEEMQKMIINEKARICGRCIKSFYNEIQNDH